MYYRIQEFLLAVDCYVIIRFCLDCARNFVKRRKRASGMGLYPARVSLKIFAIDILTLLLTMNRGNKFLPVITETFLWLL